MFSIKHKKNEILKIILELLKKPENTFLITKEDFNFMIKSKNYIIDNFLSYLPKRIQKFQNPDIPISLQTPFNQIEILYELSKGFYQYHYEKLNKKFKNSENLYNTNIYIFDFNFNFLKTSKIHLIS